MPTSTNVTNLKINELTEAQYDTAVQGGVIGANELSIITDLDEAIQVTALPTASADELGKVYQFIGTTDANYTHGYFYECVSDGALTPTYSWNQLNVQPVPTAPVTSVNTKTGVVVLNANDIGAIPQLSTLPTAASANLGMVVQYIGADDAVAGLTHGYIYECTTDGSTYSWTQTNVQPAGGSSLPSQTGNSGKFLTTDGTNASWATVSGGGSTSTTGTLVAANWSSSTQTINVTGVTANNNVIVAPAPASTTDYTAAGIVCTAQGAGTLTFTCTSTPSSDLTVNVLII